RSRTARRSAGPQPHLALFRRRGVARSLDAPRAGRTRRTYRTRPVTGAVEADQSAVVSRPGRQPQDAARVRAVRLVVSGRSLARSRALVRRPSGTIRIGGPAVRSLQHGEDAVQISGRMVVDAVFEEVPRACEGPGRRWKARALGTTRRTRPPG